MEETVSLVLFSGTDDKLSAAAIMASGAAAMGRPVHIFLQYWALDAFRADAITKDHGVAPEGGVEGAAAMQRQREHDHQHWSDVLRQAKLIGDVRIDACAHSMELLGLTKAELDPLVDGIHGVASFMGDATGPITFI